MTDLPFDDGPLDGTELAKVIAETCPGLNAQARREDWRAALYDRLRAAGVGRFKKADGT